MERTAAVNRAVPFGLEYLAIAPGGTAMRNGLLQGGCTGPLTGGDADYALHDRLCSERPRRLGLAPSYQARRGANPVEASPVDHHSWRSAAMHKPGPGSPSKCRGRERPCVEPVRFEISCPEHRVRRIAQKALPAHRPDEDGISAIQRNPKCHRQFWTHRRLRRRPGGSLGWRQTSGANAIAKLTFHQDHGSVPGRHSEEQGLASPQTIDGWNGLDFPILSRIVREAYRRVARSIGDP